MAEASSEQQGASAALDARNSQTTEGGEINSHTADDSQSLQKQSQEKTSPSKPKKKKKGNKGKKIEKETKNAAAASQVVEEGSLSENRVPPLGLDEGQPQNADTVNQSDESWIQEVEEEERIDFGNPSELDGPQRNKLFERGRDYLDKKKENLALKCFLGCLTGLSEGAGFIYLPQCLHHVADIYYQREEYEKAVQFIQAEKMYYETALIDTSELENRVEQRKKRREAGGQTKEDSKDSTLDALKATEYEELARMCLDRGQAQLALEYAGKCTKLRQQVYGENDPVTLKSLDFFTAVYAEAGKQQYTESMQRLSESPSKDESQPRDKEPSSILRHRKPGPSGDASGQDSPRQVKFQEDPREIMTQTREDEQWISMTLLWILFGLCCVVLTVLLSVLYCLLVPNSGTCHRVKSDLFYYYMRLKYYYYNA